MPDKKNNLYLYEALELRGEYKSRLNALNSLLPENQGGSYGMLNNGGNTKPVDKLDVKKIREEIKSLEFKQRKLNNAIQEANFNNKININNEDIKIVDALSYRNMVDKKIGELVNKLSDSAYYKIIHKENRTIEEDPILSYEDISKELEENRLIFRNLNRCLRKASFEILIDFKDE
ncbi:MAG: hypothetical protein ACOCP8_07030 [archaeon]